jgi:hypothetical protein
MIPGTFGTTLTFLAFVAPGLLFELLRERRRPSSEESAFREASRIALASLAFTLTTSLVMLGVRQLAPRMIADPSAWLLEGRLYLKDHFTLAMSSVLVELLIAMSLAAAVDSLLRRSPHGRIRAGGIWFHQFRVRCPDGATPWLHVRLADETEIWGFLGDYTTDERLSERELTLFGPRLTYRRKGSQQDEELDAWSSICVRGDSISWMKVTYVADDSPAGAPRILHRLKSPESRKRFQWLHLI